MAKQIVIPVARIQRQIYVIRGLNVILDSDLAELYSVQTKELNKAVGRNADRFPPDFMFQLTSEEYDALRFQSGTSKGRGGGRYIPLAFPPKSAASSSSVDLSHRPA